MDILSKHLVKFCEPALLWMSVMRCSGPGPGGQQGAQVSKCCQCDQGAIVPQGDHQPCRHSLPPKHNIEETYRTTHCRPVNIDSFFMFFSSSKVKYPWQIIQHIDRSFNPRKNMEARELILGQASTQCEQTLSSWPHAPIPFVGAQLVGLLLTTIATTGHYNLRQWRTRLPNNRTHQTTLRLKLLLVERLWWRPQIVRGLELTSLYVLNACPGEQRSAWQWESTGSRTWIDTRWPEPRLSR